MNRTVMVGIDFIGTNFDTAFQSLQFWDEYVSDAPITSLAIGISNFCDNHQRLPGSDTMTPQGAINSIQGQLSEDTKIAHWTSDLDEHLMDVLRNSDIKSTPFYSIFNYGSVINRLLLMAYAHDCDYLMRVDPGTAPPKHVRFAEVLDEHKSHLDLNSANVVSRKYSDRLALRDDFVIDKSRVSEHHRLVAEATGVNVEEQITGGALLSFKPPGVPAICFPSTEGGLTLVWASDDDFYTTLATLKPDVEAKVFDTAPVTRFDPVGKPKSWEEYYRGILGRVLMKAYLEGKSEDATQRDIQAFFSKLLSLTSTAKASRSGLDTIAPPAFRAAIREGVRNYSLLYDEWSNIADILKSEIRLKTTVATK